jgi:cytoskeletal protein CcmA (bactofilin family)
MGVFKKEMERESEETERRTLSSNVSSSQDSKSFIGQSLVIKGEVESKEEIVVEGQIEGKLNVDNRLVVAPNGKVNADIKAREVVIKGRVDGNINCSYKVEIVPDGLLKGNIVSEKVVLAEGSKFKGNIRMTSAGADKYDEKPSSIDKKEIKEKKEEPKEKS